MKLSASLALALCLTTTLAASTQQAPAPQTPAPQTPTQTFTDPANLRGERVNPIGGPYGLQALPIDQGASGLQQLLRKLNTRASLLLITAHPDDEDGGMLTLYSRGLGARVATLTLNRGEGGQNFMTDDFEDALGLIRTQELLSADRYFDASQFFGTEVDFGFSKTKEESFQKWTHERVLYDAVRAIRLYRPLVIAAVFVGGVTDGHGQHQVSGEIAQEAFKAAADPTVFPDMIREGILPWQALKVYARVPWANVSSKGVFDSATNQYTPARFVNYVTGQVTTTKPSADVIVPEGATDPLLTYAAACDKSVISTESPHNSALSTGAIGNSVISTGAPNNSVISTEAQRSGETCSSALPTTPLSYVQFARIGLGLQRTQISRSMRLPSPGPFDVSYHLYGSALHPTTNLSPQPNPTTDLSSRPKRSEVERPAASPASPQTSEAFSPKALTTQPNFFTGIDTTLEGIATLAPSAFSSGQLAQVADAITTATEHFDPSHPSAIAPDLASALTNLDQLIQSVEAWDGNPTQKANALHELRIKRVQLNDALVLALGIHLDATAPSVQGNLTAGAAPPVHVTVSADAPTQMIYVTTVILDDQGRSASRPARSRVVVEYRGQAFPASGSLVKEIPLDPIGTEDITRPYFFRDSIEQPTYELTDPALRNAPSSPPALTAVTALNFRGPGLHMGVPLMVERIVHDGPQPISIVPPVSIASAPTATVLPPAQPPAQPTAQLTATLRTDATTSANINVQSPHNWTIQAKAVPASANDTTHSINFILHPTAPITDAQIFHITAQTPDHHTYSEGYRPVGYPGLITTNDYTPATTRVVPVDLKLPAQDRIAYLPGTGDAVPEALASIGLTPTVLTVADLTPSKLANFDTIILGVRTYAAHPDLHGAPTQALLDFARNGGNVLVQYQTSNFTSADGPYPLSLGNAEKVVVETDPVKLLAPTNPLLTTPNQITPADFDNWVEERGHGFLETWDPHYTALTETHDPAQLPQLGGLIITPVGKGRWTYCAFALYRQLPEAVPGAFRLFVNLITPTP